MAHLKEIASFQVSPHKLVKAYSIMRGPFSAIGTSCQLEEVLLDQLGNFVMKPLFLRFPLASRKFRNAPVFQFCHYHPTGFSVALVIKHLSNMQLIRQLQLSPVSQDMLHSLSFQNPSTPSPSTLHLFHTHLDIWSCWKIGRHRMHSREVEKAHIKRVTAASTNILWVSGRGFFSAVSAWWSPSFLKPSMPLTKSSCFFSASTSERNERNRSYSSAGLQHVHNHNAYFTPEKKPSHNALADDIQDYKIKQNATKSALTINYLSWTSETRSSII